MMAPQLTELAMSQAVEEKTAGSAEPAQTATLPKPTAKEKAVKGKPRQLPPYHVVLLNDDDHTIEYVMEMLMIVFGHPFELGMKMAREVDETGRVVVLTT